MRGNRKARTERKTLRGKRKAQSITTNILRIMKEKFQKWMRRNNMMFSAIAGETFTNAEVVYTHIGLVVFLLVLGFVGGLE